MVLHTSIVNWRRGWVNLPWVYMHFAIYETCGVMVYQRSMLNWGGSIYNGYMCILLYMKLMWCNGFPEIYARLEEGAGVNLPWVMVYQRSMLDWEGSVCQIWTHFEIYFCFTEVLSTKDQSIHSQSCASWVLYTPYPSRLKDLHLYAVPFYRSFKEHRFRKCFIMFRLLFIVLWTIHSMKFRTYGCNEACTFEPHRTRWYHYCHDNIVIKIKYNSSKCFVFSMSTQIKCNLV